MQDDLEHEDSPRESSSDFITEEMLREALTTADVHQIAAEQDEMARQPPVRHRLKRQQPTESAEFTVRGPPPSQPLGKRSRMLSKAAVKAAMAKADRRAEKPAMLTDAQASAADALAAITQVANLAKVRQDFLAHRYKRRLQ